MVTAVNQSINQSINIFQGKTQTGQFTNLNKDISFLHDILMIIVIMKTIEPFEKIKGSSYIVAVFKPQVVDDLFIVTCMHQKIKVNVGKKMFCFLSSFFF